MAVVCAAIGLHCPVRVARTLLIPLQCRRVLRSCRATVRCWVCGVWCGAVCVVFVWWGILRLLPPRSGGGWGRVDGGVA